MSDLALLVKLQAQVAVFLSELPAEQLVALAEGRATLTVLNGPSKANGSADVARGGSAPRGSSAVGAPASGVPSPGVSSGGAASGGVASGVAAPGGVASGGVAPGVAAPGGGVAGGGVAGGGVAPRSARAAGVPRARKAASPAEPIDAAAVVEQLRAAETVVEASEILSKLKLRAADLQMLARQLQIPVKGTKAELEKRVLHLTVGARSKHAGLRLG